MIAAAAVFFLIVLAFVLFIGVIVLAVKLAWGLFKILLGLGLFVLCPVLFIILLLAGVGISGWAVLLLLLILCGIAFGRS